MGGIDFAAETALKRASLEGYADDRSKMMYKAAKRSGEFADFLQTVVDSDAADSKGGADLAAGLQDILHKPPLSWLRILTKMTTWDYRIAQTEGECRANQGSYIRYDTGERRNNAPKIVDLFGRHGEDGKKTRFKSGW